MWGTAWDNRCELRGSRRRRSVAPNEKLRYCGCHGARRLVVNFGEADRTDQVGEISVAGTDLAHRAGGAGALGSAADQAHTGTPRGQQSRRRYGEVEGVAVGHDGHEGAFGRGLEETVSTCMTVDVARHVGGEGSRARHHAGADLARLDPADSASATS